MLYSMQQEQVQPYFIDYYCHTPKTSQNQSLEMKNVPGNVPEVLGHAPGHRQRHTL